MPEEPVMTRTEASPCPRSLAGSPRLAFLGAALALVWLAAPAEAAGSAPDLAVAVRAGTLGAGLEFDLGLSSALGLRVGYSGFNISHSLTTTDVDYSGRLELRTLTALLDWYVFRGGFHLTAGLARNGTRLDVVGRPRQGSFTLDGTSYPTSQLGSLTGSVRLGNSTAPYLGIGWGNPAGTDGRVHFLLDLGAIYGGAPSVALAAQCGPAAPAGGALCSQIQGNAGAEGRRLAHKVDFLRWYPAVNVGIAVRF
jgi:hypothetical protein